MVLDFLGSVCQSIMCCTTFLLSTWEVKNTDENSHIYFRQNLPCAIWLCEAEIIPYFLSMAFPSQADNKKVRQYVHHTLVYIYTQLHCHEEREKNTTVSDISNNV